MPLNWTKNLSVKNDIIDADHQFLIDLINNIEEVIKSKNKQKLFDAVDQLTEYSQYHFAREERISRLVGYEHSNHLHHTHNGLIENLEQRKQALTSMNAEWSNDVIDEFVRFLMDWLVIHVIKEDMRMKATLQKYPADFNPTSAPRLRLSQY